MPMRVCFAAVMLSASLLEIALAVPNPPVGNRPYIFLTPDRLEEIKLKRSKNHPAWTYFNESIGKHTVSNSWEYFKAEFAAANALAYRITGDPKHLQAAKAFWASWFPGYGNDHLLYQWTGRFACWAYDWAYDGLTPAERSAWRKQIKTRALYWLDRIQYTRNGVLAYNEPGLMIRDSDHTLMLSENLLYSGLALWGDDQETAELLLAAHDSIRTNVIIKYYLEDYFAGGFDMLGPQYGPYNANHIIRQLLVAKEARGMSWPANSKPEDFLNFWLHNTFPGYKGMLQSGDVSMTNYEPEKWSRELSNPQDLVPFMCVAAGIAGEAAARNHGAYWIMRTREIWSTGAYPFTMSGLWNKQPSAHEALLFEPYGVTAVDPDKAGRPTTYFARGGQVAMRTSWADNAVALWFQNTEWNVDHTHMDALHYTIVRNQMPVTSDLAGYWGAANPSCYHSLSHNVLMIENPADGNQTIAHPDHGQSEKLQTGPVTIDVVDSDDRFGYLQGEAANNYNFKSWDGTHLFCEIALRKILWLKPDKFIVYDFVKTPDKLGKRWKKSIMHFQAQPHVESGVYCARSDNNAFFYKSLLPVEASLQLHDDRKLFPASGGSDFLPDQKHWTLIIDAGNRRNPEEFLSALYVADHTVRDMPDAARLTSADSSMTGVQFLDGEAAYVGLMKKGTGTLNQVRYTLPAAGKQVFHFITDLQESRTYLVEAKNGTFHISTSGTGRPVKATAEGTLTFATAGDVVSMDKK